MSQWLAAWPFACVVQTLRRRANGPALGAQPLGHGREEAFGREQWLPDPEGNRFLVWEAPKALSGANLESDHER